MLLYITFYPGQHPSIGDIALRLVWHPPGLKLPNGTLLRLSDQLVAVPRTKARVQLLPIKVPGTIMLGFEMPPEVVVWREETGDVL